MWLAEDLWQPGSRVALKELIGSTEAALLELRHEYATIATLRHPAIPRAHAFDRDPATGQPRFSLEHVDGYTIVEAPAREGSTVFLGLIGEVLRTLAFLHDIGLSHRDIKPANILVRAHERSGYRIALIDFGLTTPTFERLRVPTGTLAYLAPEILAGERGDLRSDLYSFGAVIFEALHGQPPFRPDPSDLDRFRSAVQSGRRTRPTMPGGYPDGFQEWSEGLLAPDAAQRPARAMEALAQLRTIAGDALTDGEQIDRLARLASGAPPGRDSEVATLTGALDANQAGKVICITGDPGAGKTRMLRWLEAEAVRRGWWVQRFSGQRSLENGVTFHGKTLFTLDEGERASFEGIRRFLALARVSGDTKLVAFTVRQSDVADARLRELLDSFGFLPGALRIDLQPLEVSAIAQLYSRATGDPPANEKAIESLRRYSAGNAAIIAHCIAGIQSKSGDAVESLEQWVRKRVEALPEPTRRWLQALCILGVPASRTVIDALAGVEEIDAEALLDAELVHPGSLGWSPSSRWIAEYVVRSCPPARRRSLFRRAAEVMEHEGVANATLAHLWKGAGDSGRSIESALRAAKDRTDSRDRAYWIGFALLELTRRDPRREEFRTLHAQALLESGQHRQAASAFATAARLASGPLDRIVRTAKRARCLAALRKTRAAEACALRALQIADGVNSDAGRAAASYALAMTKLIACEYDGAFDVGMKALASARKAGDDLTIADLLMLLGVAETWRGNTKAAEHHLAEAHRLVAPDRDPELYVSILSAQSKVLDRLGRPEDGCQALERALVVARNRGLDGKLPTLLQNYAVRLVRLGRLDRALEMCRESATAAAHYGLRNAYCASLNIQADVLLMCGRPFEGAELLRPVFSSGERHVERVFLQYCRLTLAECLLAAPSRTPEELDRLLDELSDQSIQAPKVLAAFRVTVLEREQRFGTPAAFESAWHAWGTFRGQEDVQSSLEIRALLAKTRAELARDRPSEGIRAAHEAAELANADNQPLLGATAWALAAEAHDALDQPDEAEQAADKGRSLLDEAAGRIEDPDMRRDLLARPDFERLRRPRPGDHAATERLSVLYDMIHALNSATDPDEVLESILDMALRVVQAERGMILLRCSSGDGYTVRLARNLEQESIEDAARFSRKVVGESTSGRPVMAMGTGADGTLDEYKSLGLYGIKSVICVPLRSRGEIVGAVYLDDRREGGLFSQEDLSFLEAFADHAALALRNAQDRRDLERRNEALQVAAESRAEFAGIIGRSRPMQRVFELIRKAAEVPLPVLIQGESGTGKELVARAIHFNGPRRKEAFLTENCAAMPESLLESELFGHVKGAFTGAERDREGLFEQAHRGTLFLDEVGDMSPGMQARLLRVLQQGELRRVGGNETIKADVRVIAATHRDLALEVAEKRFREDLFYRLNVLPIWLPPLRERAGDVALLIRHLLGEIARARGRAVPRVAPEVFDLLERHRWPGNVRQLENTLHRLVVLAGDDPIDRAVLEADPTLARSFEATDESTPLMSMAQNERAQIVAALEATGGNRARAAKLLGISRATIFRKIKELELK